MYLPQETTRQPDAIEKLFCVPMSKLRTEDISVDMFKLIATLQSLGIEYTWPEDTRKDPLMSIATSRLQIYSYDITDVRLVLLLCVVSETPGKLVMYMTYLQWWAHENSKKIITFDLFINQIFPFGFFNDSDLHQLWDDTKVHDKGSNNLVDHSSAMQSIMDIS